VPKATLVPKVIQVLEEILAQDLSGEEYGRVIMEHILVMLILYMMLVVHILK
jgi:hypothetical protein